MKTAVSEPTTSLVTAEARPELRRTFRFHHHRRHTTYATPELLLRNAPAGGDGKLGWMTVDDAVVLIEPGADGIVFLDRHTVLAQSVLHRRPGVSRGGVHVNSHVLPHPRDVITVDREAALPFGTAWHNYFHWMIQYLPMALHSQEVNPGADVILPTHRSFDDRMISPSFTEDTYRTSIEVILGSGRPPRHLDPGYYRFPVLHVPLFPQPSIFGLGFRERFFDRLRSNLGYRPRASGDSPGRRLMISRSGALNRKRVDDSTHARMEHLASAAGYEVLDLATMTWPQQVQTFAQASHIVAVHGAGLTNLIFSRHTTVIEYNQTVGNETHLRDPYFRLSCDLGHRYRLIRDSDLEHVRPEDLVDPVLTGGAEEATSR